MGEVVFKRKIAVRELFSDAFYSAGVSNNFVFFASCQAFSSSKPYLEWFYQHAIVYFVEVVIRKHWSLLYEMMLDNTSKDIVIPILVTRIYVRLDK